MNDYYPIVLTKVKVIKIDMKPAICDTLEKYILVQWPEIQDFMSHSGWSECIFCMEIEGHHAYMVHESLYNEVILNTKYSL